MIKMKLLTVCLLVLCLCGCAYSETTESNATNFTNPITVSVSISISESVMIVPPSTTLQGSEHITTEAFSECEPSQEEDTPGPTEANNTIVEVSEYFSCCMELVPLLEMRPGSPMWLGLNDETYETDSFLLNHYIEDDEVCFIMKSKDTETVTLYGNVVGCPVEQFVASMQDNGWIWAVDENGQPYNPDIYFLGTIINERRLAIEVEVNKEKNVAGWYLTNWPEGDYEEFYAQFDAQ